MAAEPEVRFICTDRHQHPSRELAVLLLLDDPPEDMSIEQMREAWPNADDPHEAMREYRDAAIAIDHRRSKRGDVVENDQSVRDYSPDGAGRFRLVCPSCKRDVPLTLPNAKRIVRAAVAAGLTTVDISAM